MNHIDHLLSMTSSKVRNYGVPDISSSLVNKGLVRIFECGREQQENVTPHSHKFNFSCYVLSGKVVNRVWTSDESGDDFQVSKLVYQGEMGKYSKQPLCHAKFSFKDDIYQEGDWYSMNYEQIHSIYFSKGTKVLFFEGEYLTQETLILDPYVDGEHLETFEIKPWMFKK